MKLKIRSTLTAVARGMLVATGLTFAATGAMAQQSFDDGISVMTRDAIAGKTVAYVPIAMSYDIPQLIDAMLRQHSKAWGYNYVLRDPNFSVEQAVQAVDQLITEKPDILIVSPWDASAFNRLVKKAQDAGILWVWDVQKSRVNGDAFVGANFYQYGVAMGEKAAEICPAGSSGKVAIIQTPPNNPSSLFYTNGINDAVAKHSNIQVVSTQSAGVDANKAKSIAETVLKQHPDLCAFLGLWDGNDLGIIAGVEAAGLKGKVKIISTGSGNKTNGCDKIASGGYDAYYSYDAVEFGHMHGRVIEQLLQTKPTPGSAPFAYYNLPKLLTADNINEGSCWDLKNYAN